MKIARTSENLGKIVKTIDGQSYEGEPGRLIGGPFLPPPKFSGDSMGPPDAPRRVRTKGVKRKV